MLQRLATTIGRRTSEIRSLVVPTTEAWAAQGFSTSAKSSATAEVKMDNKDIDGSLARIMFEEAKAAKVQDALKKDCMEIIDWLEDATPSDDKAMPGKLKDALPSMGKHMKAELFEDLLASETMQGMTPPMRSMLSELAGYGHGDMIVPVVYKYMALLDPKAQTSAKMQVELVVPSKESEASLADKKAMLVADMTAKGTLAKDAQLDWLVSVDPNILGGCIYRVGDVEVDCSIKTLQDEFYSSLDEAGVERVE